MLFAYNVRNIRWNGSYKFIQLVFIYKRRLFLVKQQKNSLFAEKEKRLIGLKKTAVLKKTVSLIVHVTGLKDRGPTPRQIGPSF